MTRGSRSLPAHLPGYITSRDAAAMCGRSDRWLQNLRREGKGPRYTRFRGWPLYRPKDVASWLDEQTEVMKS